MKQVRIAELKSHLIAYLRSVREGQTITVLDRATPVARIVPVGGAVKQLIRKRAPGAPAPNRVRLPKPLTINVDVMDLLMEERRKRGAG